MNVNVPNIKAFSKIVTHTYLLTPWSRVLLEKPIGSQLVKKFPAFYGTRRFITAFTRFCVNISYHDPFLRVGVVSASSNPQAEGPPHVSCPLLLFQYILSYPPYGGRSSIRNPRTRHAVVTGTNLSRTIYNKIHVLLSTLSYMFRRLLRQLQVQLYRILLLQCNNSFEHTIKFSLKMAQ